MRLALYQPDIPQNTGTILRLGAALGVPVDIIEPCGFALTNRGLKRALMDYADLAEVTRHAGWPAFETARRAAGRRLVLLTTRAPFAYTDARFTAHDTLLLGRESAGVPDDIHQGADERVSIPLVAGARSLNVAVAAAMVLGEALRQTGGFPAAAPKGPAP